MSFLQPLCELSAKEIDINGELSENLKLRLPLIFKELKELAFEVLHLDSKEMDTFIEIYNLLLFHSSNERHQLEFCFEIISVLMHAGDSNSNQLVALGRLHRHVPLLTIQLILSYCTGTDLTFELFETLLVQVLLHMIVRTI